MDGWIKLYRKIAENPLYFAEPFTRMQAWIDMLIIANNEEGFIYVRGNKVQIKRGQIGRNKDALAERWGWSRGKALRFLEELEKDGQIVQQKSRLITLISIVNYDIYQGDGTTERISNSISDNTTNGTSDGITNGTSDNTTNERQKVQQTEQQTDANKNNKNNINIILSTNADNISSPSKEEEALCVPALARNKPVPAKKIQEMWNTTCAGYPKIYNMSESRKNKMRVRIEEMGGEEKALPLMKALFEKMQANNFLKGDNKRGWKASFDWLFENDKNWVKVHEGNYDNQQPGSDKPEEPKERNYDETIF